VSAADGAPEEDPFVRIARLQNELGRAQARLATIQASTSYRFTLRALGLLKRLRLSRSKGLSALTPMRGDAMRRLLVVAIGDDADLATVVAGFTRRIPQDVRALFLTTTDDFMIFRDRGFQYEHVPSAQDYETHFPERDYSAFLQSRATDVCRWFRPEIVLVVGDAGFPAALGVVLQQGSDPG
jgi:hypothetical protein